MITRDTLHTLRQHSSTPKVSLFLPTSPSGPQTLEAPIHLVTLLADARRHLADRGVSEPDADKLLAPASDKASDSDYWQHQRHGLALFLSADGLVEVSVETLLAPSVVVGDAFDVLPLMPTLADSATWAVLCASEAEVGVYVASATSFDRVTIDGLPASLDEVTAASDYENPVLASPPARPNTGTQNISNAQVYGDAPPEWKEKVRRAFAEAIASAVARSQELAGLPLVVIADEKLAGDLTSSLSPVATNTIHPSSLSDQQRHDLSKNLMSSHLDQSREALVEKMEMQLGRGDLVATDPSEIVQLAEQSRVETLFVSRDTPDTTISLALWSTLRHGGEVVWAGDSPSMPESGVVALLRH